MLGKIDMNFFEKYIINRTGYDDKNAIVKPKMGVDVGIIKTGDKYIAVTTDPLYINPALGLKNAAWFALHILLSDLYTSGIKANYMSIDFNLPESIKDDEFKIIWDEINNESLKYNLNVITGHTARYENCNYPMIGGVTLIGIGDDYITTENAHAGDKIIMTKTCALEASVQLAYIYEDYIIKNLGENVLKNLKKMFYDMSCINEEILAINYGIKNKITSMHDATEGGLLNAIYEIGYASNNGIFIDKNKIIIDENVKKLCDLFNINPLRSISEGTLLITVKNDYADKFLKILNDNNIKSSIIGEVRNKDYGIKIMENDKLTDIIPGKDDFWKAVSSMH
ncbi:AIR synthase family protein [Acidiplasma sp.]|uniref:AIR synthase family protein n=1 Tax=Acidiplasma sp. TaxID=1872114 RepID=UPI0025900DC1|nr:AIR synthase family protein [Acidiplasma sp.]